MSTDTANAFVELFGESLVGPSNGAEVKTTEALSDKKVVGIYFSAHWCPPCRGFTPKLAEWYTKDLKNKGMEIVFVSSDRDQAAFDSYAAEQPWLSLPYPARELKAKLSKKYKVSGIPSFVIVDGATGETITAKGREAVSSDPTGENLPWKPQPLSKQLADKAFITKQGDNEKKTVSTSALLGPVAERPEEYKELEAVAFYFSAHWCPPCRSFTPALVETYKKVNSAAAGEKQKKRLEVVFVSCDQDQAAFDDYFKDMPWLAVDFSDKKLDSALSNHFETSGIPRLVVVSCEEGKNLEVINNSAVGAVRGDEEGKSFPWAPPAVKEVDSDPEGIDEDFSLVVLMDKLTEADEEKKSALIKQYKAVMEKVQKKHKKVSVGGEEHDVLFFAASKAGPLAGRVASECSSGLKKDVSAADTTDADQSSVSSAGASKEKGTGVRVVMMHIEEESFYAFEHDDFTEETCSLFFEDLASGLLKPKMMGA